MSGKREQVARHFSLVEILAGWAYALFLKAKRAIGMPYRRRQRRWDLLDMPGRAPLTQMIEHYWFGESIVSEPVLRQVRIIGDQDYSPGPSCHIGGTAESQHWEQPPLLFQQIQRGQNQRARAIAWARYCMIHPREKP